MTDIADGVATGRSAKTYYQKGTRASRTGWLEVELVSGSESFDPGKENTIVGEVRESGRKYQESGAQEGAVLKFKYQRPRGIEDTVFEDLLASYEPGGDIYEWAVMDGDVSHVGAVGWVFFGEVTELSVARDLDKFIEYDVTIEERATYESEAIQELLAYTVPSP